jgi:hypothetical protein
MRVMDDVVGITDKPNPNFPIDLALKAMQIKLQDCEASRECDRIHILNAITKSQSLPVVIQTMTWSTIRFMVVLLLLGSQLRYVLTAKDLVLI